MTIHQLFDLGRFCREKGLSDWTVERYEDDGYSAYCILIKDGKELVMSISIPDKHIRVYCRDHVTIDGAHIYGLDLPEPIFEETLES